MPRRTPVKELQSEESVVSSPLRRSSRLSNISSVGPSKVITRRNSASEVTAPATPKATRGRRSSLSQTAEVGDKAEDDKKKLALAKTKSALFSNGDSVEVQKPRTRGSSVPKESEPKRVTRGRAISEDKEIKNEEQLEKKVTTRRNYLTKKTNDDEVEAKSGTPVKISPPARVIEPMEPITEIKEEQDFEITASSETNLVKKISESSKIDLDLSVIRETSLIEEEVTPQKNSKGEIKTEYTGTEEKERVIDASDSKKKLTVELRKEDVIELNNSSENQNVDKLEDSKDKSIQSESLSNENNLRNKENISPNVQDEPEPMDVDAEVEEILEVAKEPVEEVDTKHDQVLEDQQNESIEEKEDPPKEADKIIKELPKENQSTKDKSQIEETEQLSKTVDKVTPSKLAADVSDSFEATTDRNSKTVDEMTPEEVEVVQVATIEKSPVKINPKKSITVEIRDKLEEERASLMSPSEEIILTVEDGDCVSPAKNTDISQSKIDINKSEEAFIPSEESENGVNTVNDDLVTDGIKQIEEKSRELLEESTLPVENGEPTEKQDELSVSNKSINSNTSLFEGEDSKARDEGYMNRSISPDGGLIIQSENKGEKKAEQNGLHSSPESKDLVNKDESYASENDESYKSPVKKLRASVSDDDVFTLDKNEKTDISNNIKTYCILKPKEPLPVEHFDSEAIVEFIDLSNTEENASEKTLEEKIKVNRSRRSEGNGIDAESNEEKNDNCASNVKVLKHSGEDKTLITLKDTIKAGQNKEARLSDRIHKVVDFFCSGIKNEADVSVNVSFEYTGLTSDVDENCEKSDLVEISFSADLAESKVESQRGSKRRKICPIDNVPKSVDSVMETDRRKPSPMKRKSDSLIGEENAVEACLASPKEKRIKKLSPNHGKAEEMKTSPKEKETKLARRKSLGMDQDETATNSKDQQDEEQTVTASPKESKKRRSKGAVEVKKSEDSIDSPVKKQLKSSNKSPSKSTEKTVKVTPPKKQKISATNLFESEEEFEMKTSPKEKDTKLARRKSLGMDEHETATNSKDQQDEEQTVTVSPKESKKRRSKGAVEVKKSKDSIDSPVKKQLKSSNKSPSKSTEKTVKVTPPKKQKISATNLFDSEEEFHSERETVEKEESSDSMEEDGDDSVMSIETEETGTLYKKLFSTSFDVNDDDTSWRPDTESSSFISDGTSDGSYEPSEDEESESDQNEENQNKEGDDQPSEEKITEKEVSPKGLKRHRLFRLSTYNVESAMKQTVNNSPAPKQETKSENEIIVPTKKISKTKKRKQGFFVESENAENIVPETSELRKEKNKPGVGKKNNKQAKTNEGSKKAMEIFKPSLGENVANEPFCRLKPSTKTLSGWKVTKM